jgi:hypothetical protein
VGISAKCPDLFLLVVHMHVGRGDVAALLLITAGGFHLLQLEGAGLVDGPGPLQPVGMGQADIGSSVIGEVQIVLPQRLLQPVGNTDQ